MDEYNTIFNRLKAIEAWGVKLNIGGETASIEEIADLLIKENCGYMPDYIYGEDGSLDEINYDRVVS
ncbi:MAG: hypothetical protein MJ123_00865 [Lachnospiraceae bacterium]|nr:hypothetical protein [Lachnospiraceae bacterium]